RAVLLAAFLVGAAATLGPRPALAESATSEGAKALAQSLIPYFGQSAFDRGLMSVTPKGEAYEVRFDLQGIVDGFGLPKGVLQIDTLSLLAAPLPDGNWKISCDNFPKFVFGVPMPPRGDLSVAMSSSGRMFEGIYDPKLAAFLSSTDKLAAFDFKLRTPDSEIAAAATNIDISSQSKGLPDGSVSGKVQEIVRRTRETITSEPRTLGNPQSTPLTVSYDIGPISYEVSFEAARAKELLDLAAFFVTHQGLQEIIAHQDELRNTALSAFPLFKSLDATAKAEEAALDTPAGRVGAKSIVQTLHQTGLAARSATEIGVIIDGLSMPSRLIPAWASPLVPTSLDVDLKFEMNDLDKIAHAALAGMDLRSDHPPDPGKTMALMAMAMGSEPKLTLAPGHMSAPGLELYYHGDMVLLPQPVGTLTLEAEGLDKALARLQDAAKSNPELQQAVLGMNVAKGLAKPGAQGRSIWVIAYGADGAVSVNGRKMGASAK
ncbi:MAG: hypothetical protein JO310_12805, partial [Hyphomicrobiales bacterium]|nr:hypothetical protein [Hyphomicrobiales bacterium]